jgi:hypothetical protein
MAQLYLLFNHTLTREQQCCARSELGVEKIVDPPPHIRALWANIPAGQAAIRPALTPVFAWIDQEIAPGDFLLVQGDFGACWLVAKYAEQHGIVPVYATTRREATERHTGDNQIEITHTFRHVRFRQYGK